MELLSEKQATILGFCQRKVLVRCGIEMELIDLTDVLRAVRPARNCNDGPMATRPLITSLAQSEISTDRRSSG